MDEKVRLTVAGEAEAEIEEKRSVFIGQICPVANEDEARAFIERIKKKHYDARHNVFAYILDGGSISRFTDDGEPKGSAGIPVLNVLKMSGATDVCVVVTRYFGGILLGTGGLVRAYSAAAKAALDAAGLAVMEMYDLLEVTCSYSDYQKLQSLITKSGAIEEDSDFGSEVTMRLSCRKCLTPSVSDLITQATAARCKAVITGEVERKSM